MIPHETITCYGGKIAYIDTKGSGFPVVLIHGNSCSSRVFKKQIESFGKAHRLIAVDLPGHGKSENAKDPDAIYNIPSYAKILDELIHKLQISRFATVGFSLGGNIALQWSQISKRIQGIVMISSSPMKYSEEALVAYPPYVGSYAAHPDVLTREQATEYMKAGGFQTEDPTVQFMIEDAIRCDPNSRAKMVASVLAGNGIDETQIVSTLEIPLAVIIGRQDVAVNREHIINLKFRNLWRKKVVCLPHAGHALVMHQTNPLHVVLEDFLKEIEPN